MPLLLGLAASQHHVSGFRPLRRQSNQLYVVLGHPGGSRRDLFNRRNRSREDATARGERSGGSVVTECPAKNPNCSCSRRWVTRRLCNIFSRRRSNAFFSGLCETSRDIVATVQPRTKDVDDLCSSSSRRRLRRIRCLPGSGATPAPRTRRRVHPGRSAAVPSQTASGSPPRVCQPASSLLRASVFVCACWLVF